MNLSDYDLVGRFGAEYRGIVQYYLLAGDVWRLDRLRWVMLTSMLKTLAAKHRSTVTKMARKYSTTVLTSYGRRRCFEARVERAGRKSLIARFGGIPLKRRKNTVISDQPASPLTRKKGKELLERVQSGICELCKKRGQVKTHHIRSRAEIRGVGQHGPRWAILMNKMRRKTLVTCAACHEDIHQGIDRRERIT